MTESLPAFPELPSSPEAKLRWIAWGNEIARLERERCAVICEILMATEDQLGKAHEIVREHLITGNAALDLCAAAIRSQGE
jgi:hypothetical protein